MRPAGGAGGGGHDRLLEFIEGIPKAELHLHLEGAIRPQRLLRLARKRGIELPADDEEGIRRWFRFQDFAEFIETYVRCSSCLRDPEDFQAIARDLIEDHARRNVVYCEAHFTISTHIAHGVNAEEVACALSETIVEGEKAHGVRLRLIPDIVRNLEVERADRTLEWALAHRDRGVVALGIAGMESAAGDAFREHFRVAADAGLHRTAHAGEIEGPQSVRWALDELGAERIGHGVRAVEDTELVEELVERAVPLEVCPTSNIRLGVADDWRSHPLGDLYRAGVTLSVNTDDPAIFDTDINTEYREAAETLDLDPSGVATLAMGAFEQAFLPAVERERLSDELIEQAAIVGERVFGRPVRPRA